MKVSISNLAWDVGEDTDVTKLLWRLGVRVIDIAPTKYFSNIPQASTRDILNVKHFWNDLGFQIVGLQSLMFGTLGFNLFSPPKNQLEMLTYLEHVCRISALLGAKKLVFGSPKNRDRSALASLDDLGASDLAADFFYRLGAIAKTHDVEICLEPASSQYGCNFMTNYAETIAIVKKTSHPSIKLQLDTGAIVHGNENIEEILSKYAHLVGHIHVSEPGLIPIGDAKTDHVSLSRALKRHFPTHTVSIEMLATAHEPHLISIERAVLATISHYAVNS